MLILLWPPSILSPNKIAHWSEKAKAKAKYKQQCWFIAQLEDKVFLPEYEGNFHLNLIFHPPTKRHYDIDNLLASMKSGLDGIALAWKINDTRFRPITIDFGDVVKGGQVILKIIENNSCVPPE